MAGPRSAAAVFLLAAAVVCESRALLKNPNPNSGQVVASRHSVLKKSVTQSLDNFWTHRDVETYDNHAGRFFKPAVSSTFSLIKLNNVNVTFLDNTNLRGYDAADIATLGHYKVMTRMGMIEHCNSRNFDDVDGILGFGWADQPRSAALLKTLTQRDRPGWNIHDQIFQGDGKPMPRKFAFTADDNIGELQLGGVDPSIASESFTMFPMAGENVYGIKITSITYGGVELLHFDSGVSGFTGEFDSGTTCLLLPNTDVKGNFTTSPFGILAREQLSGKRHPLLYTATDVHGVEHTYSLGYNECVEPTDETMILGDPWFRKWIVMHDLTDLDNKRMGLALRSPTYRLGIETDDDSSKLSSFTPLSKLRADRKVRPMALALTQARYNGEMVQSSGGTEVDKVALKSQSRVTYNVKLSIGSPPQPLEVIFDTGSFMLAVFADQAPAGMKPILDLETGSLAGPAAAHGAWSLQVEQLGWILADNRDALVATNAALIILVAAAVALVARSRRGQRGPVYVELSSGDDMLA